TGVDGRVLQFSLGSGGAPTSCGKDLTAGKMLGKTPQSLAWIPPLDVAWGDENAVFLVDANKDLLRWRYQTPRADVAISVFPLIDKSGATVVGVGYDTDGFGDVKSLYMLDLRAGTPIMNWSVTDGAGLIYLGSFVGAMAQSPLDPTHVFYLISESGMA